MSRRKCWEGFTALLFASILMRTTAGQVDLNRDPKGLIEDAFVLDPARNCVYARDNQLARYGDALHWRAPTSRRGSTGSM